MASFLIYSTLLCILCFHVVLGSDVSAFLAKVKNAETAPLKKLVHMNDTRALFVAGLEGAGHHALSEMFRVCERISICKHEDELSALSVGQSKSNDRAVGLFAGYDGDNNHIYIRKILHRMRTMTLKSNDFTRKLFYIGLTDEWIGDVFPGMLSYPNGPSPHKNLDRPDIFLYAALAETVKLDFRFIILLRNAHDTLHSTIDKRQFGNRQPQILISNAETMYMQMLLIDPAFYKCVNYEDLVGPGLQANQKHNFIDFLHPAVIERDSSLLDQMLSTIKKKSEGLPVDSVAHRASMPQINTHHNETLNRAYHALQLQARLNLIKQLCAQNKAWL